MATEHRRTFARLWVVEIRTSLVVIVMAEIAFAVIVMAVIAIAVIVIVEI